MSLLNKNRNNLLMNPLWERLSNLCIYLAFFILIFCWHLPMDYISDDAVVLPTIETESLLERFIYLYHFNGRIFTDTLANLFYRMPMMVWKVFDSFLYILIAHTVVYLFTQGRTVDRIIVCMLIALYPISYLSSAGYIATSTNYVYPVIAVLLTIIPLVKPISSAHPFLQTLQVPVSLVSLLYAVNHDQTAVVLIAGLLLYSIYLFLNGYSKQMNLKAVCYWLMALGAYLFMYFMPGHINRMSSIGVGDLYPPNYINWSIWKKAYVGYSSTVANIMFFHVPLFQFFCFCLMLLSWKHKSIPVKLIGTIPASIVAAVYVLGRSFFVTIYPYAYWMPDLKPVDGSLRSLIPLLTSVVVLICILTTVILCVKKKNQKYLLLLLLTLAAGSREMMGFSATVYRSSYRTFTFFLYALICCNAILIQELQESGKKKFVWYTALSALVIIFLYIAFQ